MKKHKIGFLKGPLVVLEEKIWVKVIVVDGNRNFLSNIMPRFGWPKRLSSLPERLGWPELLGHLGN